ncbi:dnaJ homolog subfamily C member 25 homolog [Haliotis cracherodii]|uniref:dnaJ homolog subfamily C member 25 homolog n=1 Tax=Haliotis rufescens TaxID=6454 RepID=UPI001EB056B0|nr:dnaJ homolog subfamily C member 25 homolog [Haliotis rufescens]
MARMAGVQVLVLLLAAISCVDAFIEGLYCGRENCYEILGVTRDSTKNDIVKAYRKMARKWHPDMHRGKEAKEKAAEMFQTIANAYEILRDEEQRVDYDYMLDNPDEYYSIYFNYYRRRMAPKVDIRIVIGVTITVVSVIQYWGAWNNYTTAINYLCREPKYRTKAIDIAKSEGTLSANNNRRKKGKSKEELKEEEEAIIRQIIEEKMDIRGGYSRPSYRDILWIQLVFLPYYTVTYFIWWITWIWKFTILRHEYGEEEKFYKIRRYMKLSQSQWDALEDYDKENFLDLELWKWENFEVWREDQENERKSKLAESARYKSYRRYMKKGGAGQISFGPE